MRLRRISSLLTFPSKFLFPAFFFLGFLDALLEGTQFFFPDPSTPPVLVYLAIIFFELLSIWHSWSLKKVSIDETNRRLYVSNYRKEIAIPFSGIAEVKESIWTDPRRITIKLRNPTEFGGKVVFLATYRFGGIFAGSHPIVDELRAAAAEQGLK
jgi:hypothetical protein